MRDEQVGAYYGTTIRRAFCVCAVFLPLSLYICCWRILNARRLIDIQNRTKDVVAKARNQMWIRRHELVTPHLPRRFTPAGFNPSAKNRTTEQTHSRTTTPPTSSAQVFDDSFSFATFPFHNYLSLVPDGTPFTTLDLLGLHDAATGGLTRALPEQLAPPGLGLRTSSIPIRSALERAGVRALDIRLCGGGKKLDRLCHGVEDLGLGSEELFGEIIAGFLRRSPSETVVVVVKPEGEGFSSIKDVEGFASFFVELERRLLAPLRAGGQGTAGKGKTGAKRDGLEEVEHVAPGTRY